MKIPAIILWNRVFERYDVYNSHGNNIAYYGDCVTAQSHIDKSGIYAEVPINSRIGRQILAKIGERKV